MSHSGFADTTPPCRAQPPPSCNNHGIANSAEDRSRHAETSPSRIEQRHIPCHSARSGATQAVRRRQGPSAFRRKAPRASRERRRQAACLVPYGQPRTPPGAGFRRLSVQRAPSVGNIVRPLLQRKARARGARIPSGRFDSAPVETEAHLLAAIRYIHLNPLDTGASHPRDCPWSSYGEYVGKPRICDTSLVLELVGGAESFEGYCDPSQGHDYLVSLKERGPYLSEAEAERVAASHLGADFADRLALLDKSERDRALRKLRALGLSVRQIERLTGVGRNIVARA